MGRVKISGWDYALDTRTHQVWGLIYEGDRVVWRTISEPMSKQQAQDWASKALFETRIEEVK